MSWPLPNVWLGVSVENQRWADKRIPLLLGTPTAKRFVSCEPLLGPPDLSPWLMRRNGHGPDHQFSDRMGERGRLHWVIAGGESGPRARPMNLAWARNLRDQCVLGGIPFFYKQQGGLRPGTDRLLDGSLWEEWPDA